jgi:OmpR family response regulator RpaB
MSKLLLIDDDEKLGKLLTEYLARHGLNLVAANRPSVGLKLLTRNDIDLVILDVMLPEMDGFEVCREIRKNNSLPIVMLTARGDVTDRIVGLELGADDYLPKPFEPRELVVRIQNILKRVEQPTITNKTLHFQNLMIDRELHSIILNNKPLSLTTMEFELLVLLASAPNRVFSRDDILNQLKGVDADIYSRSIDIAISRLRNKLKEENGNQFIKTIWGKGYAFIGVASE